MKDGDTRARELLIANNGTQLKTGYRYQMDRRLKAILGQLVAAAPRHRPQKTDTLVPNSIKRLRQLYELLCG